MIRIKTLVAAALTAMALWHGGLWASKAGKAWLAPILLDRAFHRGVNSKGDTPANLRPWPWADHYVSAKLWLGGGSTGVPVLGGDIYRGMAFAPVEQQVGAASIMTAHRDTHFRALQHVTVGDRVSLQRPGEPRQRFEIVARWTAHKDALGLPGGGMTPGLLLVTCYPFDALRAGGPMRLLVWAVPVQASPTPEAATSASAHAGL